jgi:hypothetical protein
MDRVKDQKIQQCDETRRCRRVVKHTDNLRLPDILKPNLSAKNGGTMRQSLLFP